MQDTIKAEAQALQTYLASIHRKVTRGQAYEAISRISGEKSWNVHSAKLTAAAPVASEPVVRPTSVRMPVEAQVWADDKKAMVPFDAREWFEQASNAEVLDLFHAGWLAENDKAPILAFYANRSNAGLPGHAAVWSVLDYAHAAGADKSPRGIAGSADKWAAMAWLKLNRRALFDVVLKVQAEKQGLGGAESIEAELYGETGLDDYIAEVRQDSNGIPNNLPLLSFATEFSAADAARLMKRLADGLGKQAGLAIWEGKLQGHISGNTHEGEMVALMDRTRLIAPFGPKGDPESEAWAGLLLLALTHADKLAAALCPDAV
jgi:hypothetical protein